MNKNYEAPFIEIIKFENEIHTAGASIVIEFPWVEDGESEFFE